MSNLTESDRAAIRNTLGWDWQPEPPLVPSVDEVLADLYVVITQIVTAHTTLKEHAMENLPPFDPALQPGNPGFEPGRTKYLSDQTDQERDWTRRLQSAGPAEQNAIRDEMRAAGQWWPGRDLQ